MHRILLVQKYGFDVQVFHAKRKFVLLPDLLVLILVVVDPFIGCVERINHTLLAGDVCIELHAEAVNIVELEADKVVKIFFFILARCHIRSGVVEAEDVFYLGSFKHLAQVDTVRKSNTCHVDLKSKRGDLF